MGAVWVRALERRGNRQWLTAHPYPASSCEHFFQVPGRERVPAEEHLENYATEGPPVGRLAVALRQHVLWGEELGGSANCVAKLGDS